MLIRRKQALHLHIPRLVVVREVAHTALVRRGRIAVLRRFSQCFFCGVLLNILCGMAVKVERRGSRRSRRMKRLKDEAIEGSNGSIEGSKRRIEKIKRFHWRSRMTIEGSRVPSGMAIEGRKRMQRKKRRGRCCWFRMRVDGGER